MVQVISGQDHKARADRAWVPERRTICIVENRSGIQGLKAGQELLLLNCDRSRGLRSFSRVIRRRSKKAVLILVAAILAKAGRKGRWAYVFRVVHTALERRRLSRISLGEDSVERSIRCGKVAGQVWRCFCFVVVVVCVFKAKEFNGASTDKPTS